MVLWETMLNFNHNIQKYKRSKTKHKSMIFYEKINVNIIYLILFKYYLILLNIIIIVFSFQFVFFGLTGEFVICVCLANLFVNNWELTIYYFVLTNCFLDQ